VIDEPQIDDIDAELGVDNRFQRSQDVFVHLTASLNGAHAESLDISV
jgi:hypothetical protein